MNTESHEVTEFCQTIHCYSHDVDEADEPSFRFCYGCSHVFPTEQALIDDDNACWARYGDPMRNRSVDDINCCPHCVHDF
jgi:hypothetical protein